MNGVIESLIKAVDEGRTDVVRGVIAVYEKGELPEYDTEDYTLDNLLNSLWTTEGTFMHRAAKFGKADIVRALLHAGADPGVHNSDHKTALDLVSSDQVHHVFSEELLQCIARSDIGRICQLVASGVSVNLQDSPESRNTPLHWAASFGSKDVIQCLCKRGSNVNAQNGNGATPLHDAVSRGHVRVVEELLANGADQTTVAHAGKYAEKSPFDLAVGKIEMIDVMKKFQNLSVMNGIQEDRQSVTSESGHSVSLNNATASLHNGPIAPSSEPTSPDASTGLKFQTLLNGELNSINSAQQSPEKSQDPEYFSLLWPRPQRLQKKCGGGVFKAKESLTVYVTSPPGILSECLATCESHRDALCQLILSVEIEPLSSVPDMSVPCVKCEINKRLLPGPEHYTMAILENQVKIQAADRNGLHHALSTFIQLLRGCETNGIPYLKIEDGPCLRDRGLLLDISKGRIPTMVTLKNLINLLAFLKMNQLQLYHRLHIPNDSSQLWQYPYTKSEVLELERYCVLRCVELVPVIDIAPNVTYEKLTDLCPVIKQLLSCFLSASIVSIGPRLSPLVVEITESGALSLDDTRQLLPIPAHQTVQLCAYVFHDLKNCLDEFPFNAAVAEYGFQADFNFEEPCNMYSQAGIPFTVVPGSAAWNSLAGCPEAAVGNIQRAIHAAKTKRALGILLSHWSGIGHMTHQTMIWPAIVTAAGLSWNSSVNKEFLQEHLADLLNTHVFLDRGVGVTGQVLIELGRAETYLLRCARGQSGSDHSDLPAEKGSTLYQLLSHPDRVELEHLTTDHFQKAMRHIRKCQAELSKAQIQRHGTGDAAAASAGALVVSELQLTADLMLAACRLGRSLTNAGKNPATSHMAGFAVVNMGVSSLLPTMKTDIANRLLALIDTYRNLWLCSHLPAGLQDSMLMLTTMLAQFIPESSTDAAYSPNTV